MRKRQAFALYHEVWKLVGDEWCSWTAGKRNTAASAIKEASRLGDGFAYVRVTVQRFEVEHTRSDAR